MSEDIREVKIEIEVDTNKRTVRKTFDDMDEAKEWFDEFYGRIYFPNA